MEAQLKEYVETHLRDLGEDVEIEPDDDLVSMGFDSIGYVRLLDHIHAEYGIHVPDADVTVERFGTVANIAGYLTARMAAVGTAAE